jgi:hypothetical protein
MILNDLILKYPINKIQNPINLSTYKNPENPTNPAFIIKFAGGRGAEKQQRKKPNKKSKKNKKKAQKKPKKGQKKP